MSASAIKLSKVSKRYGKRRVLHDVSFEVNQSELCALVGANGAGKSTLIKIVLGLCEPSSGSVELFGGKSKKELSLMRTRVGYVPDSSGAYQSLSAVENLRIRCAEWGIGMLRRNLAHSRHASASGSTLFSTCLQRAPRSPTMAHRGPIRF